MSYFKKYYRKSTGNSKFKGAVLELFDDIKFKIGDGYQSLKKNSAKRNSLLISGSILALYLSYKEPVDSWFDDVNKIFHEELEDRKIRREERRTANYLEEYKTELSSVKQELSYLNNSRDSLAFLVEDLEDETSEIIEQRNYLVESVKKEVDDLKIKKDELEKVINDYTNLKENKTSSGSKSFFTKSNDSKNNESDGFDYWVAVRPGSSLSEIAAKYYGSASEFGSLAEFNGIDNPDFVIRMQPVKLCSTRIINFEGVNQGVMPLFEQVNRQEYIDDFVKRVGVSVSVEDIIEYNVGYGNNISDNRKLIDDTGVVYLEKNWVD